MPHGTAGRPLTANGRPLREEGRLVKFPDGERVPLPGVEQVPSEAEVLPRTWRRVLNSWRSWYAGYESMHIEYEGPGGEVARSRLENSYQPRYGKRYYAKLKDLERAVDRRWSDLTTVMVTFTASHENANGLPRMPADHMREVQDGWETARKHLYHALSGYRWEYATVWEPHADGYGHMHVAVFVDGTEAVTADEFRPVMESYVGEVKPAAWEAHRPEGEAVSVNSGVNNVGSYISEYIGIFGERPLDRPVTEQMFYATAWATGTRRVRFSEGANELIRGEKFRRETGLYPEMRGVSAGEIEEATAGGGDGEGVGWKVEAIERVSPSQRNRTDPTAGGVQLGEVKEAGDGVDPPKDMGPPPGG
jgi:hypothetical protein